ncbi:MAG TPA: DUF2513 domain-containing protein [Nostocaceae cyanobacterium]|nr:DUF2513 domain-containing protein [Nostocaceae cyanobacterium]
MKKDSNLLTKILLAIESEETATFSKLPSLSEYNFIQIEYHIYLLADAGFIIAGSIDERSTPSNITLTWDGHKYLENQLPQEKNSRKWNSNLDKKILLALEAEESDIFINLSSLPDYNNPDFKYHVRLLHNRGFIVGGKITMASAPINFRLTWRGHEYLNYLLKAEES